MTSNNDTIDRIDTTSDYETGETADSREQVKRLNSRYNARNMAKRFDLEDDQ